MKQRLILMLSIVMGATTIAVAQGGGGGGFQRQTPEQRTAAIHAKLDSAFKTPAAKLFADGLAGIWSKAARGDLAIEHGACTH